MLLHGWPDAPRGWWLKPLMLKVPDFEQSKRFWYQWLQCIDGGAEAVDSVLSVWKLVLHLENLLHRVDAQTSGYF